MRRSKAALAGLAACALATSAALAEPKRRKRYWNATGPTLSVRASRSHARRSASVSV